MIKFIKKFSFAHNGIRIEHFTEGQIVENPSERLKEVALKEKVAIDTSAKKTSAAKGKKEKSK